ncbi:MAG: hypothetical protein AB1424_10975 [Thermodesulfobacteriota bacterium]
MNPGIEAVRKLANLGYRFTLSGDTIKAKYEGPGKPDPAQVRPLMDAMKAHKPDVVYFLRSYCPTCGGVCFIGSLCMACDWRRLVELYPDLEVKQ